MAWSLTPSGPAFVDLLEDSGLIVARVTSEEAWVSERERRGAQLSGRTAPSYRENEIVVVDKFGSVTRIDPRTTGDRQEAITERLADIDPGLLMSITDARSVMKEVSRQPFIDSQQAQRPATKIEARINRLQREAVTPEAFAASLCREGIHIARVDRAGMRALDTDRWEAYRDERPSFAPYPKEGELVAINRFGSVYRLNPHRIDVPGLEDALTTGRRTIPNLGAARKFIMEDRAAEEDAWLTALTERGDEKRLKAAEQQKAWKEWRDEHVGRVTGDKPGLKRTAKKALRVVDQATGKVSGVAEFMINFLAGAPAQQDPKEFDLTAFVSDPAARAAQRRADGVARAEADAEEIALENIRRNIEAGGDLSPVDLANLTREHQEQIKAKGDDRVREIIEEAQRRKERGNDGGREREW